MAHHEHHHAPDNYFLSDSAWTKVRNSMAFVALVSWIAVAAGFALERQQAHFSYLIAFVYFVSVTLGAMFYVMVQHLTGSAWSVTVRRLMENIMRAIPLGLILVIPVFLGTHSMYEWAHADAAHDPILSKKLGFLNDQWFVIRSLIVLGLWSLFSWRLYAISRKQDDSGSLVYTKAAEKWSAPGVLILFLTGSLASFDWVMSLDPHWWSTMFGVYFISGGAVAFMSILILICLGLRGAGYLTNSIKEEHYHDLGKWLFALTIFWAYVTFSQYMLIWYGNLPEENVWFQRRLVGNWSYFRPALIFLHFFVPFFALMPRSSKRNLKLLGFFAGWLIVMHYVDLFWQVMPVLHAQGVSVSWIDLAAWLAVGSSYGLVFWSGLRKKPLVPVGDPRLEQCLAFHNV
jgi:hypothetical protein